MSLSAARAASVPRVPRILRWASVVADWMIAAGVLAASPPGLEAPGYGREGS